MLPKITFITRHYPPNPNINGESVCDMVQYFEKHHHFTGNVICIDRGFEGGGMTKSPAGQVYRLKTPYQGKNPIKRFITFLYDGYVLARKALRFKHTLLVCTTSPPLLPLWAAVLFKKKNTRWALWAFDLFPEGFNATGQIARSNRFYRWALKKTYHGKPAFIIALGPKQAAYLQHQYHDNIPTYILPCGVMFDQEKSTEVPSWRKSDKIYLGYCGNLGDPHNPELIKAVIDQLNPEEHCLVLALYGNRADEIKAYARDKPGIIMVDRVPRDQLHFIDVHLVTLRSEWTHIAVPSKAVSAVSLGCPILFCGSPESDNWHLLQKAGWFIAEDNIGPEVKLFLQSLNKTGILQKKAAAGVVNEQLRRTFLHTYEAVAEEAGRPPA